LLLQAAVVAVGHTVVAVVVLVDFWHTQHKH
jgi:hypothetical protein